MTIKEMILCSSLLVASFVMPSAQASANGRGTWASDITTNGLTARYSVSTTDDVFFGANYSHYKSTIGTTTDTQSGVGMVVGYRHYLSKGDVSRFVTTALAYNDTNSTVSSDTKITSVFVAYGLEKMLSDSFSVEGAAGVSAYRMISGGLDDTRLYIPAVEIGMDYYFK